MPPIRAAELIPDACKPKRTRTKVACNICRKRKLKCDLPGDGSPCKFCRGNTSRVCTLENVTAEENNKAKCRKTITSLRTSIRQQGADPDEFAPLWLVDQLTAEEALVFERNLRIPGLACLSRSPFSVGPSQDPQASFTQATPSPPTPSYYDPQAGMDSNYAMQLQEQHGYGQMAFPNGVMPNSHIGCGQPMMSQPTQPMMSEATESMMPQQSQHMMLPQPSQPMMHQPSQSMMHQSSQSMMHQPSQSMMHQPSQSMKPKPTQPVMDQPVPQSTVNMMNPQVYPPASFDMSQFLQQFPGPIEDGSHAMYNNAPPQGVYQAPPDHFAAAPAFLPTRGTGIHDLVRADTSSSSGTSAGAGMSRHSSSSSLHMPEHHPIQSSPECGSSNTGINQKFYSHPLLQAVNGANVQSQEGSLNPASEVAEASQVKSEHTPEHNPVQSSSDYRSSNIGINQEGYGHPPSQAVNGVNMQSQEGSLNPSSEVSETFQVNSEHLSASHASGPMMAPTEAQTQAEPMVPTNAIVPTNAEALEHNPTWFSSRADLEAGDIPVLPLDDDDDETYGLSAADLLSEDVDHFGLGFGLDFLS